MHIKDIIISFLTKYFFILKAASDGWRIQYIGGNRYEFVHCDTTSDIASDTKAFLDHYLHPRLQKFK